MEMKKLACAVIFVAASLSAVMANVPHIPAVPTTPVGSPDASPGITVTSTPAAAPGPSSGAAGLVPLIGATILSFVAYNIHF
ncbi:arabinogalactan protein 23-like [Neltuma alba]|uniref:arabinogalactan protein 23-like n=1 Tax=Neltuma alba TaxID=207710 RepID=UPI0010A3C01F|nr:arabinogalactan protein 23-like [Prosopis alba]